jgi:hypothetical protein
VVEWHSSDPLDRPFHFTYPVKESLKAVEEMSARVGWGSHGVYETNIFAIGHACLKFKLQIRLQVTWTMDRFSLPQNIVLCFTLDYPPFKQYNSHKQFDVWRKGSSRINHAGCHCGRPGVEWKLGKRDYIQTNREPTVASSQKGATATRKRRVRVYVCAGGSGC